jgi:hypothetical protein
VPDVLLAYAAALAAGQAREGIERLRDHLVGFALTAEELHGLPEAERAAWQRLWADVATTKDTKNTKEEKKEKE